MSNKKDYTINEVLKSLIEDGEKGKICLESETEGDWYFYARFFAEIEGESNVKNSSYPVLKITDYKKFKNVVNEYLKYARPFYNYDKEYDELNDFSYDKYLIFNLLVNAEANDFENICNYVQHRTQMLKNVQEKQKFDLGSIDSYKLKCGIQKCFANLEAPYKFVMWFQDEEKGYTYVLPTIYYGITDNYAYIGAVQGQKHKQNDPYSKKVDRFIRKVNKDVPMDEIEGNVSPSAVVSMTVFNAFLKSRGVERVLSPSFTPVRYHAMRNQNYVNMYLFNGSKEAAKENVEKRDQIQKNVTEKLLYLYSRYCHHFTQSECFFDENTGEMKMVLKPQTETKDNMIYDVDRLSFDAFEKSLKEKE